MKSLRNKTGPVLAGLLAMCVNPAVPTHGDIILLDFGNASSFRGVDTPSPDSNGNYWNSVWSGAYYPNLIDVDGNATTINLGFSSAVGTDYYNGPSGPTQDPAATIYNAAALGNLGVNEAVYDYYVTSTFEIQGLDPAKRYNLTFYGAHQFNANPTTEYAVYTDGSYSTLVDSTTLDIHEPGSPWLYNQDAVSTISNLAPQTGDILYVRFRGDPVSGGDEGYLNAMQIEVIPEPGTLGLSLLGGILIAIRRISRR